MNADGDVVTLHSDIAGRRSVVVAAASDVLVSIPFRQAAVASGIVQEVNGFTMVISGNPEWESNQWSPADGESDATHELVIVSGDAEGISYRVVGNSANVVVVDSGFLAPTDAGVRAGDRVQFHPRWTLATAFRPGELSDGVSLRHLPVPSESVNPTPVSVWEVNGGAWYDEANLDGAPRDDTPINSGDYFVLRNTGDEFQLTLGGNVVMHEDVVLLHTRTDRPVDNARGVLNPTTVTLAESGLAEDGVFLASDDALRRGDMVLVYDLSGSRYNREVLAFYIYWNAGWRKLGEPLDQDFGGDVLQGPGRAAFIRLRSRESIQPLVWRHRPVFAP